MEQKRGWLWSARYFFAFHWAELGGWVGSTAVSLYGMLAPDRLQPSSLIAAVPDWAWLLFLLACYAVLAFVAFHRMREKLRDELEGQRVAVAAAETAKEEAEKRYAALFQRPEVGPGLVLLRERPETPENDLRDLPPDIRAAMKATMRQPPGHRTRVSVRLTRQIGPPSSVYVWTDAPIHEASAICHLKVEGETGRRALVLKTHRHLAKFVSLGADDPIEAGHVIHVTLHSTQPLALRRIALEPNWQPGGPSA